LAELVELPACQARQLLLGLRLADGAYRQLDLPVGLGHEPLRLGLGRTQDLGPFGPDFRQLLRIVLLQLLDLAVGETDAVALLLPIAAVAGDLAQLFFDIHVVAARLFARGADDLLRQSDLAGDLHGERTAGLADLQPEKRTYLLHVEHHGAVGDPRGVRSVIFDIGVVGRDDAVASPLHETFEDRLGDRAADRGLRTRSE